MGGLVSINTALAGFFACAAIFYALHWGFSRRERVLLVFSVQCVSYTVFCVAMGSFLRATTVATVQATLDRFVTVGVLVHVVILQFFADLGGRRDGAFRAIVTAGLIFLATLNQWAPLRGTVLELRTMMLPGGGTALLAIRTPPGTSLALLYLLVLAIEVYGFFVARAIWKRDRLGGIFVALGTAVYLGGAALGLLVDFAHVRAPYSGALPHAMFVVLVALHLSRRYAARGAQVVATESRFETVFEHSPIGKALLAPDGRLLRVNRAFCRIVHETDQALSARRLSELFREDDDGSVEAELQRLLRGEVRTFTIEKRLVRREMEPAWALLVVSVVPDDRGRPIQMTAHLQDVTEVRAYREGLKELVATRTRELRAAKDEAERASQAKSWFLTNMSHEIRSPLQVMLLNAAILEHDPSLGAEPLKCIAGIQGSGEHLAALINNVLEMSTVEAGRLTIVEAPFDAGATLEEVAQMFAASAAVNGTELSVELNPGLPRTLLGDGGKVKQILINLVSNAIKFTRQGSIRVVATSRAVTEAAATVEISVADTGKGIGEQDLARMFRPFEQLDNAASAGGTGLGLAISHAYARLMGGDISVESELGVGSRFKLRFVADLVRPEQAQAASGPHASFVSAGPTRSKVLVVDDVDAIRNAVATLLARNFFETRTAADGLAALSIHSDWRPDVVLMDLRMPGMNGVEVIRRLRAEGSKAVIGALTAGAFGDDEHKARSAGADFFIRKPFSDRELLDALVQIVAARGAADRPPS